MFRFRPEKIIVFRPYLQHVAFPVEEGHSQVVQMLKEEMIRGKEMGVG